MSAIPCSSARRAMARSVGFPTSFPIPMSALDASKKSFIRFFPRSSSGTEASCTSPPAAQSFCTLIRFCVSVPVLSEQMTEMFPIVSTAVGVRTTVFFFAMLPTPYESAMVTTTGITSGIAATATETATMSISGMGRPYSQPMSSARSAPANAMTESAFPSFCIRTCKGESFVFSPASSLEMRPISVALPVRQTIALPFPLTASVPEKTICLQSAAEAPSCGRKEASLTAGSLSPVRSDSSAVSPVSSRRRASAGTRSPTPSRRRSPGTSSSALIFSALPPRTTVHV